MRTTMLIAVAAVATVGCAGAASTDVVPTGAGNYMVTSHGPIEASGPEPKAKAFDDARMYCEKSGKRFEPIRVMETGPGSDDKTSTVELHFRCVSTDTPQ
jgi:hypothetical protein